MRMVRGLLERDGERLKVLWRCSVLFFLEGEGGIGVKVTLRCIAVICANAWGGGIVVKFHVVCWLLRSNSLVYAGFCSVKQSNPIFATLKKALYR